MQHSDSARRPPFLFWTCLWGLGAAVPLVAMAVDLLYPDSTRLPGRDFVLFWAAGRVTAWGEPALAYDVPHLAALIRDSLGVPFDLPFVYPPIALIALAPFGAMPYPVALAAWTILGAVFFIFAARRWVPFSPWLAALTPAALLNIWDGQFGFVFGGLWLLAFSLLERRPLAGGAVAALLALKPHLGAMILPRLILFPRAIVTATLVFVGILAATLPFWRLFFAAARDHSQYIDSATGSFFYRLMPGAYAAFGQSWIAHLLFAGAAIVLLVAYRRTDCFTLATASFLILPYAHNYDMTVACLGPAILLHGEWPALSPAARVALALAFLSPALTLVTPWLVPPILLVALWVQLRQTADSGP